MWVLGIDEAGRGCVIGPMVVGGVLIAEERLDQLVALGVKDSKKLTARRREALAPEIEALAERVCLLRIPAPELDRQSLNQAMCRALRASEMAAWPCGRVYCDAPVAGATGLGRYTELMRLTFVASQPEVIAENHADDRYPVVGAASILAKVARDAEIAALREQYGDFGSGYCSDERTVRFLQEQLRSGAPLPDCIRRKWGTVRRLRGEVDGELPLTEEA